MELQVSQEIAFIVPALWVIGLILKSIPKVPNFIITLVILVLGILFSVFVIGFDVNGVVQGIVASGVAVLGHQLVKQLKDGTTKQ